MLWVTKVSALFLFLLTSLKAGPVADLGSSFVDAALKKDYKRIGELVALGDERKAAMIASLKEAGQAIDAGEISLEAIGRELVIGDLGVTLIKVSTKSGETDYDPLVCVKTKDGWRAVPWENEKDLKKFAATRTPDEQIHLQLFDDWAHLVMKQIAEEEGKKRE